ncbi:hypothetical protein TNCV_4844401 [Trichonephila clavipes]|uniref:Uncharacterized protein n=1 Tax=Trichonephila clavipes TaxID=2585209 RepID=A0A8X6WJ74_TRICX|nr:hypothetical protein TNCV_4844401 [Trichonephila clavipes]
MAVTITKSHIFGFFKFFLSMGHSQTIGVSRGYDFTNRLSFSFACCLYFGGHCAAATLHSSTPQVVRACLDMHGGHFELPL